MIVIPLLVGLVIGGLASTVTYAKWRNKKDKRRREPTPVGPYKMKYHKLVSTDDISWTPAEFKSHIQDLAQSMANLDDLSFVQVEFKWIANKHDNHPKREKSICNLKTFVEMIGGWTNVHTVKEVTVHLIEIMEPELNHPHQFNEQELKIIEELRETEDYRLKVAKMNKRKAQAQRSI